EALLAAERGRRRLDTAESWIVASEAEIASGQTKAALASAKTALARAQTPTESGLARIAAASAQHVLGDGDQAVGLTRQALDDLEQGRPYDKALALHVLAESLHVAGRFPDAAEIWRQVLSLRRELMAADHPEIGATVHGMALTMRRLGLAKVAADLHEEALTIYTARLDDEHPAIAATRHGLAQALHRLGRPQEAREQLSRALEVSERRQGPDHPHTWITRFELGRIEVDCGDLASGYRRMEAARMRLTEQLGTEHPTVQAILRWM
ncbi:MAG: tetratricopeptide (TPR) repeat protein, partial [Myxococcota bacterium]